jgi:tetratricopeptide (TPR) repeat protein
LKKQLAAAQAILQQSQQQGTHEAPNVDPSAAANDDGMRLYKEKKYPEAAAKFAEAAKLDPANALFPNNAGFAYYKMQEYEEAVLWYQQAIALDPKRAVAYLNLGDACAKLNQNDNARKAYEKYLELAPDSKVAPGVREKLQALTP